MDDGLRTRWFLSVWVEVGGVALALLILCLLKGLKDSWYCFMRDPSPQVLWYITTIVFGILYNIDEASFLFRFNLLWMMIIAAIVGLDRKRRQLRRNSCRADGARMTTYHLLTETEPFSEPVGGAISRWAANVLRDDESSVILAPSADDSWSFPAHRIRCNERLSNYARFPGTLKRNLPWPLRRSFLRWVLSTVRPLLKRGDVVWVHNRPEFAATLQASVRKAGARLVLHMHNSHLSDCAAPIASAIDADRCVFVSRFLEDEARRCSSIVAAKRGAV